MECKPIQLTVVWYPGVPISSGLSSTLVQDLWRVITMMAHKAEEGKNYIYFAK
jgi:hypothetical protein